MMQGLVGRCDGKSPLEIRRLRWENNVETGPGCGIRSFCPAFGRVTGRVFARASLE